MSSPRPSADAGRPRRAALRGGLLAGAGLALSACGIRLEDDAPKVPLVPTRTPIPGEAELLALLHAVSALAASAPAAYAAGLGRQAAVLDSALRERGVPQSSLSPSPSASGSGATSSVSTTVSSTTAVSGATSSASSTVSGATSSASSTRAVVGLLLAALPVADAALRPVLGSMTASHVRLSTLLDDAVPAPARGSVPEAAGLALLAATREAVYGTEVAAARSTDAQRTKAIAALERLRGWATTLEEDLGADAPPMPTAYALPLDATDNATAKRLIAHLTRSLVQSYAAVLPTVSGDAEATLAATGWLSSAVTLDGSWGATWDPFPGLS